MSITTKRPKPAAKTFPLMILSSTRVVVHKQATVQQKVAWLMLETLTSMNGLVSKALSFLVSLWPKNSL